MAVPDNGSVIVGISWWLCFFSAAFLALRVYAKLSRQQKLWWDDYILIASWVIFLVQTTITQAGQLKGFGKHTANIRVENLPIIALYTSIGATLSCFASTGSKISFGVTLLRLTEGKLQWFVWFCIVTLFMVMMPSSLLTWIQCTPREKSWNFMVEGTCWKPSVSTNYGIFNAAWCAVVDFALALLPWHLLWNMTMMTTDKIGVGIAMSLGVLSGICAIVKGVYLVQLREQDFYYNGMDVTIWTAVEIATAVIGASIPVLRVFLKEKASTLGYGNSKPNEMPLPSLNYISQLTGNTSRVDATRMDADGPRTNPRPREDSASDRSISGDDGDGEEGAGESGILATSTVFVNYEGGSDAESGGEPGVGNLTV